MGLFSEAERLADEANLNRLADAYRRAWGRPDAELVIELLEAWLDARPGDDSSHAIRCMDLLRRLRAEFPPEL